MRGRMKTLRGIYRKHGKDAFLEAAEYYSCHVDFSGVSNTICQMESRWYDRRHMLTEADKMLEDYNAGQTILN